MVLQELPDHNIQRDTDGIARQITHIQAPYTPPSKKDRTPRALVSRYMEEVVEVYNLQPAVLANLDQPPTGEINREEVPQLRQESEKVVLNSRIMSYTQTVFGLPVWEAGLTITMENEPLQVISSVNTFHYDVDIEFPNEKGEYTPENLDALRGTGTKLLAAFDAKLTSINGLRLIIYRYDPEKRIDTIPEWKTPPEPGDLRERHWDPSSLPDVPDNIQAGRHYIVTDALFTISTKAFPDLSVRTFIEIHTGAILFVRFGVTNVNGSVFPYDPVIQSGDSTITPCSSKAILNNWRATVLLEGLTAPASGNPQELTGEYVYLGEHSDPAIAPPTEPVGTDFIYDADTDDFSAVNAYNHIDQAFRLVEDLGFSLTSIFDGTTFPVKVDHRDDSKGEVQAMGHGNSTQTGSDGFSFNLAKSGCPVGIAADFRVVWHEFCHALLWDQVHSPNFGFSHSAGDSLGVILSDWGTQSPDRFDTFPFVDAIDRRHDRDVTAGWAWGGTQDGGGYDSEQILATTLFRFYRSIGGDSPWGPDRELAAYHTAFLIIGAIASLTPTNNAATAEIFATTLMDFDKANDYAGISRGALHKVFRWAFERQGLYQPAGAPTPVVSAGTPPDVDVYIDDGRAGTYEYQYNFWNSQDMWNRLASDGGTSHETPILNTTNYLYVRVKNRGTQTATNVSVKAYHCIPSAGLIWPTGWQAMSPASLAAPSNIPSGSGGIVVGPFAWTPTVAGHECLLAIASATGDFGNDTTVTGTIPHGRFVPFDNNIGQRNVAPVAGGGGGSGLTGSFSNRHFWFHNQFDRVGEAYMEVIMPDFLAKRNYRMEFLNPGGDRFKLGPRESREIILNLQEGDDFTADDVPAAGENRLINVLSFVDGQLVGGMSYDVDPHLTEPPIEHLPDDRRKGCLWLITRFLRWLGIIRD